MARQQSDLLMVSADRPVEMDGVVARLREPVRAFVMPAMGQDEAPGRSFIMQTIPNTTFAGQTGTAAAAARNTEAGRAL